MPNPSDTAPIQGENFDYSDEFAAEIANDVGSSLFGESKVEVEEKPAAPVAAPVAAPAPPDHPNIVPGQNSVAKAMPKSWRKEMEPHWNSLPPEVHEYVHTREAQVMRGIQQYQGAAQQWQALIEPYAPVFQAQPDAQPVQIMQGLMNTHLQLLNPSLPTEKKQAILSRLAVDYGIPLEGFTPPQIDPRVSQLEQQLQSMQQIFQNQQRASYEAGLQDWTKKIEAFAADPKNAFFHEVGNDILRFIQTGAATDLQSAYELACWANPAVRAKMMGPQPAPSPTPAPAPRAKNGQFVNLDTGNAPPARTRVGSMDDTINGVIAKAFNSPASL